MSTEEIQFSVGMLGLIRQGVFSPFGGQFKLCVSPLYRNPGSLFITPHHSQFFFCFSLCPEAGSIGLAHFEWNDLIPHIHLQIFIRADWINAKASFAINGFGVIKRCFAAHAVPKMPHAPL